MMSEVSLHFGAFAHALRRVVFFFISSKNLCIVAYLFEDIRVEANASEWVEPRVRAFRCER